jgi:hypothetical protein
MVRSCTWASAGTAHSVIAIAAMATAPVFMAASSCEFFEASMAPLAKPNHMTKDMSKYK